MSDDRSSPDDTRYHEIPPRFDAAHVIHSGPSAPESSNSPVSVSAGASLASDTIAAAGQSPDHSVAQLQQQAAELASHLRAQQRSLAQREATLHAQIAQWEHEQRAGRLWLRERAIELNQRAAELDRQVNQLELTQAAVASVGQTRPSSAERIARQIPPPIAGASRDELKKLNAMLLEQLEQIQHQRKVMAHEYEQLRSRTQRQRRQLAERTRRERRQLKDQQETLRHQKHHWVLRKSSLEGLRGKLLQRQQSLETSLRLLQQIWSDCCEQLGENVATERLEVLRKRDCKHGSSEQPVLGEYKRQLEQLAVALQRQQRQLERRRAKMHQWMTDKQRDLKRQSTELNQHQAALEDREIQLAEDRSQWFRQWSRQQSQIQQWLQARSSKAA